MERCANRMLTFVQWRFDSAGDGKFYLGLALVGNVAEYVRDAGGNVTADGRQTPTQWVIKGPDGGPYTLVPLSLFFYC